MTNLSDTVKQVQTGDLAAFETLVRQFQDMGVGYAHALVGDFHIAEGIAQKSFFQNYRDLNKLEKPAAFPSWFQQIVIKHCDRVTRRSHVPTVSLDELVETVPGDDSTEDRLGIRDRNNLVQQVLNTLPEQERTCPVSLHCPLQRTRGLLRWRTCCVEQSCKVWIQEYARCSHVSTPSPMSNKTSIRSTTVSTICSPLPRWLFTS